MTAPLVLALPFIEGETLHGYVSRNAALHETTPRNFCSDLGMRWPFLCSGHDGQIERLAWLTETRTDMLRTWCTKKIGIGHYQIGKTVASTGILRRTAVRLCPKCVVAALTETGPHGVVQQLEWSILGIYCCPKHKCSLITLPSANHSHATYDFVGRILRHRGQIQLASEVEELLPGSIFEQYVRERIWVGPQNDWLQDLDLTNLHRTCLTLGGALSGLKGQIPEALPIDVSRSFCDLGLRTLLKGKKGYKAALPDMHRASTAERSYYSADMGPLYHWLRGVQTQSALAGLLQITRQHIFDTYPIPMDKEVFGKTPSTQKWLTMEEARKRSGFGAVFLKRLLGHIDGVPEKDALKRTDVHVEELEKVALFWGSLINLKDAAALLGILPQQVKSLQNRGVLSSIKITSSLRYLKRTEVTGLLDALQKLPSELPAASLVPLQEFCRSRGVHLARVIDLWSQGKLDGQVCLGSGDGLQALEVDCNALCEKTAPQLDRDLQLPEAARYLQSNISSIRRLRDHGFLCQKLKRNPDTNHMKCYISEDSIRKFENTYITLGQMASCLKVASIHLAMKLDRDGVQPLACGDKMVRAYSRKAVGWADGADYGSRS